MPVSLSICRLTEKSRVNAFYLCEVVLDVHLFLNVIVQQWRTTQSSIHYSSAVEDYTEFYTL